MGESYMVVFPADPLLAKPDWPRLRAQLLERGLVAEPKGNEIPFWAVRHLWDAIMEDRAHGRQRWLHDLQSLSGLLGDLKNLKLVPMSFKLDCSALAIPDFIAALQAENLLSPKFSFDGPELLPPGPLYDTFSDMRGAATFDTYFSYQDHGDRIMVACGEGLFCPPGIPGTDRVCEEWQELMDRWYKDPTQKWIDPETGKGYGILDLDWNGMLGAGKCMLEVHSPAYLDGNRVAELLTALTGQKFRYAHYHI